MSAAGLRFGIAAVGYVSLTAVAFADVRPEPYAELKSALQHCGNIDGDEARLRCFDAVLNELDSIDTQPPPAVDPVQEFGAETQRRDSSGDDGKADGDAVLERIQSTIARLERRPRGEYLFHLANGQTWTEVSPGRARYRQGIQVTIERTPFGGYMLSTDSGGATRVQRLR